MRGAFDVQLEAGRPVERAPAIGADLGADLHIAQKTERAPRRGPTCKIEVKRLLPFPPKVEVARRVEERRQLG